MCLLIVANSPALIGKSQSVGRRRADVKRELSTCLEGTKSSNIDLSNSRFAGACSSELSWVPSHFCETMNRFV